MDNQKDFLDLIENYLTEHRLSPSVFSKRVVGDPTFVRTLRNGRSPRLKTVERVLEFIRNEAAP